MKITLDIPDSSRAVFINLLYSEYDQYGLCKQECVHSKVLVDMHDGMKVNMNNKEIEKNAGT